jgi:hypothetical protein
LPIVIPNFHGKTNNYIKKAYAAWGGIGFEGFRWKKRRSFKLFAECANIHLPSAVVGYFVHDAVHKALPQSAFAALSDEVVDRAAAPIGFVGSETANIRYFDIDALRVYINGEVQIARGIALVAMYDSISAGFVYR